MCSFHVTYVPGSIFWRPYVADFSGTVDTSGEFIISYWFDNLGFTTEGNLLLHYFTPSSWGLPTTHPPCASVTYKQKTIDNGYIDLNQYAGLGGLIV